MAQRNTNHLNNRRPTPLNINNPALERIEHSAHHSPDYPLRQNDTISRIQNNFSPESQRPTQANLQEFPNLPSFYQRNSITQEQFKNNQARLSVFSSFNLLLNIIITLTILSICLYLEKAYSLLLLPFITEELFSITTFIKLCFLK